MLDLVITYNTGVENVGLKTRWDDLVYTDYLGLLDNSKVEGLNDRINANIGLLTGLTPEVVQQIPDEIVLGIIPFLKFIDRIDNMPMAAVPEHIAKIDIGSESWGKLEQVKQIIRQHNSVAISRPLIDIVKIYTDIDITDMPFVQAYPISFHFKDQLENFFSRYTRLNDFKPTSEQKRAGIDQLNQYGYLATLHSLCKGDPLKYNDMLNQPAGDIYDTLVYDFEINEYQKRLTEAVKTK